MAWLRRKLYSDNIFAQMNPIIRILTTADFIVYSGFGLIAPIFAVFVADQVPGGSLTVVGVSSTIFFLARSLGQLPAAQLLDKIKGERDDTWALFLGYMVTSMIPLMYLFVTSAGSLYFVQAIYGLGQAFTYPSWLAMFTRHVDKDKEAMEWSFYNMTTDLSGAAMASLGAYLSAEFGFRTLLVVVSIISTIGSVLVLFLMPHISKKQRLTIHRDASGKP